jgi:CBS domain-containing protein
MTNFLGVITDHDIASRILFENRPLNKIAVREFMSRTLPVATSESSLEYGLQLMERYSVRHLAIFDRFQFRGVVSSYDLMHEAIARTSNNLEEGASIRHGYPWNY